MQMRRPSVPVDQVVGRPVGEVAELYRAEGFEVRVVDLDVNSVTASDLRSNRIFIVVRDGRVVEGTVE